MAANKFATILHRNTNKITLILIYAVLEWVLIVLLLLNSLFSYLITKFAEFFGLKPPCPWCTRLDHIFDPEKRNKNVHIDLLCEAHAKEISKMGFCSNHRKLAESQGMCLDCSFSKPEFRGFSNYFALFQNDKESVVSLNCACCGESLDDNLLSSYILLKTLSLDVFQCANKENLIAKAADIYDTDYSDKKISNFDAELCVDGKITESDENVDATEKGIKVNCSMSVSVNEVKEFEDEDEMENEVWEMEVGVKLENVEEKVALIMKDKSVLACVEEDTPLDTSPQHLEFFLDYSGHKLVPVELVDSIKEETQMNYYVKIENCGIFKDHGSVKGCEVQVEAKEDLVLKKVVLDVDLNEEPKFEVLESMEMEENENSLVFHAKDCQLAMEEFEQYNNFQVSQFISEDAGDVQEMGVAAGEMHYLDIHTACEETAQMENNGNEADVSVGTDFPDFDITDEIHNPESYERTYEDPLTSPANHYQADDHVCATEESLEGSVTSDLEVKAGVVIRRLKSTLKAERKTLQDLYAELEEERNASEVAANQTMAMINRLQEEKAAIQMEAFQYQRMMEEQSEYDQEALQLLNELMVKGEKEKQEVEKELEVYKRKVLDYETKKKIRILKKSNGSGFCSSTEDSDELSIDLNQEFGDRNARVDGVRSFEECLADFEDERLSILAQLKVLEEKLVTLDDDNEQQCEDINAMQEIGNHVDVNAYFNGEANGDENHFVNEVNGKHYHQRSVGSDTNGVHDCYAPNLDVGNKKLLIEEVDYLYKRLQAFERDREFFKHCARSIGKGDKGIDLLQEILQHLRDLRNTEPLVRH